MKNEESYFGEELRVTNDESYSFGIWILHSSFLILTLILLSCQSSRTVTRTAVADSSRTMVTETVTADSVVWLSQTFRFPMDTLAYISTLPTGIGTVRQQGKITLGIFGDGKGGLNLNVSTQAQAKTVTKRTEQHSTAASNATDTKEEKPPDRSRHNTLLPWLLLILTVAVLLKVKR